MKSVDRSIKKKIKKKIDLQQNNKNMGVRDKLRVTPTPRPIPVQLLTRTEIRMGKRIPKQYHRKGIVDYDIVICIPSNERYKKVKRLISQFYEQSTKYTFKIILLNDGSKSNWYDTLPKTFPNIIYIKNEIPNGKILHWYCYNQMWDYLRNIECHTILQMDDDFIICDNFLDIIIDEYFTQKKIDDNMRGIAPHMWSFKKIVNYENWWGDTGFVDGICLLDPEVIKKMDYVMHPVDEIVKQPGVPVRTWTQINNTVNYLRGYYYKTPESLVYHDGNDDSKLHGDVRIKGKGVYTQKLVEDLNKYYD